MGDLTKTFIGLMAGFVVAFGLASTGFTGMIGPLAHILGH